MNKILGILLVCSISFAHGQTEKAVQNIIQITNIDRYGVDYELVDVVNPDPAMLELLDLDQYEYYRHQTLDIEVYDFENSLTILLYSVDHCVYNKTNGISANSWSGSRSSYVVTTYFLEQSDETIIQAFQYRTVKYFHKNINSATSVELLKLFQFLRRKLTD